MAASVVRLVASWILTCFQSLFSTYSLQRLKCRLVGRLLAGMMYLRKQARNLFLGVTFLPDD
jgi:hypothetical protein